MCFDDLKQNRNFILRLFDAGMKTDEYVYVFPYIDIRIN